MIYTQTRKRSREWDVGTYGFWDKNGSLNPDQTTRPCVYLQNKRTWNLEDFAVLEEHWVEIKKKHKERPIFNTVEHEDIRWYQF